MTYRELLTLYKEGELSEDQKVLVEQELEKAQAINDYLADEIEEYFGQEKEDKQEDLNYDQKNNVKIKKSIKKAVNRRLASVVGISVISVFIIILVIQNIISPLVASRYYDPTKKTVGQEYHQDLCFDLSAITEVSMPGYGVSSVDKVENLGFGEYNIGFTRYNTFTRDKTIINTKINKGIHQGPYEDFHADDYVAFTEFWDCEEGTEEYKEYLDINKQFSDIEIEHVKELPSTSYISAWVRFSHDLNMEELYEVIHEYSNVNFEWIAVRTAKNQGQQLMGFSTNSNSSCMDTLNKEKYPGFKLIDIRYLPNDKTSYELHMADIYETHFTSLLKYLVDRKDVIPSLLGYSINYDYQSAFDYIQTNGINTYGAFVYGEASDLLELYESGTIMTFDINNVIPSKYIQ